MWVEETLEILTTTDSTFFIIVKLMDIATNCIQSIITSIKDLIIIDRDRFRIQMLLTIAWWRVGTKERYVRAGGNYN